MSLVENVSETLQITTVARRTWRVECFTDFGSDYELRAHRERVYLDAGGNVVKREPLPTVTRKVSQVSTDLNAMLMLKAVKDMCDAWAVEDGEI